MVTCCIAYCGMTLDMKVIITYTFVAMTSGKV